MSETPRLDFPEELSHLFASLDPQDVDQFYSSYQLWQTQQHIAMVQARVSALHQQIAENAVLLDEAHPSAIAFSTLVRLQAEGVQDIQLLDRMLARGEAWLDNTMQHLDYCERFDFIDGNYTQWCEHALEGAYDWIDSMREAHMAVASEDRAETNGTLTEATEELLLERLSHDIEEADEPSTSETTLKVPRVGLSPEHDASQQDVFLVETPSLSEAQHVQRPSEASTIPVPTEHVPSFQEGEPATDAAAALPSETILLDQEEQASPAIADIQAEIVLSSGVAVPPALATATSSEEIAPEYNPAFSDNEEATLTAIQPSTVAEVVFLEEPLMADAEVTCDLNDITLGEPELHEFAEPSLAMDDTLINIAAAPNTVSEATSIEAPTPLAPESQTEISPATEQNNRAIASTPEEVQKTIVEDADPDLSIPDVVRSSSDEMLQPVTLSPTEVLHHDAEVPELAATPDAQIQSASVEADEQAIASLNKLQNPTQKEALLSAPSQVESIPIIEVHAPTPEATDEAETSTTDAVSAPQETTEARPPDMDITPTTEAAHPAVAPSETQMTTTPSAEVAPPASESTASQEATLAAEEATSPISGPALTQAAITQSEEENATNVEPAEVPSLPATAAEASSPGTESPVVEDDILYTWQDPPEGMAQLSPDTELEVDQPPQHNAFRRLLAKIFGA